MRHRTFATLMLAVITAACDAGLSEPDGTSLGPLADLYLNGVVDIMEAHSVRRFEIDWVAFREQTLADAAGAVNSVDTYPAIVAALERIGDNHSFFRPPGGQASIGRRVSAGSSGRVVGVGSALASVGLEPAAADPRADLVESGVGYVDVPEFNGGGADGDDLAAEYHRLIEAVDTLETVCRWVVDLRGNTGGNMWPMVAGVGPILGASAEIGAFFYPDSVSTPWFYDEGRAGVEDVTIARAAEPYTLGSPLPWVAVLTDSLTASSGEAVAVAFRGRAGARSFGEATWGVSTANAAFPMPDGAVLFLTVATLADRSGEVYGGRLVPDEPVAGGTKTGDRSTDAALEAALQWLQAQPCS